MNSDISNFVVIVLKWYVINQRVFTWRAANKSNYYKIIAEIFLQRTKAQTVSEFLPVFIRKYSSWKSLSEATRADIEVIIKPLGLIKRRTEVLISLSKAISNHGGRIPCERVEIDRLPGVGQYIGNSIELLCCGKAKPLLDVNMARVLERYFGPRKLADIRFDPYLQDLAHKVVDCPEPIKMNWAIMDFAAIVCKARKPSCPGCPLASGCKYYKNNNLDFKK